MNRDNGIEREWIALLSRCVESVHQEPTGKADLQHLVTACRGVQELHELSVTLVDSWPRYLRTEKSQSYDKVFRQSRQSRHSACAIEIVNFLMRSRLLLRILTDRELPADALDYLKIFQAEAERKTKVVTQMVLLDGLSIREKHIQLAQDVWLHPLSKDELSRFFEVDLSLILQPTIDIDLERLSHLVFLVKTTEKEIRGVTSISINFRSVSRQIHDVAQPWASYINLTDELTIRPIQLYVKSDHLLEWPIIRQNELASPSFRPEIAEDGTEYESPEQRVIIDASFAAFAMEMERGRLEAAAEHRADTALRFFARSCDEYIDNLYPIDDDELENVVVSTVIALEAMLLDADERNKTTKFTKRGAALLKASDADTTTAGNLLRLYRLRSLIVHGGQRQQGNDLQEGAQRGQTFLRSCLRAFLRIGGNQKLLIDAVSDAELRKRLRPLTARP